MAKRPANAGSGGIGTGSAGSPRGLAPMGDATPPFEAAAPPPPVRHDAISVAGTPRTGAPRTGAPRTSAPHAAALRTNAPPAATPAQSPGRAEAWAGGLSWLPYLIVLTGVTAGIVMAWQSSKRAAPGVAVVGCSLLVAALARLVLPDRYAGLLASRRKASDVLAYAVLGAAMLAVVLSLP